MSTNSYASDFSIAATRTDAGVTFTAERLYHLDEVTADGEVVAYICCAQSRRHARKVARREATERRIPLNRIAISRGAA